MSKGGCTEECKKRQLEWQEEKLRLVSISPPDFLATFFSAWFTFREFLAAKVLRGIEIEFHGRV